MRNAAKHSSGLPGYNYLQSETKMTLLEHVIQKTKK